MTLRSENIQKGVCYLLLTSFLFSSQQALGKVLYYLSSFERTFYFSLVAAVIMAMLCKKEKVPLMGAQPKLLFFRSLFGFLSTILVFAAATDAYPIANLSLLSSTSTIFALIAAVVWLKERMGRGQVLAIFIAFGGIVLLLKPTGGFLEQESLLALGGGFFAGLAYTVVRRLKGESPYSITFFFMVFSVIVSFPLALWQGMHPLGLFEIGILLLLGAVTAAAQFFLSLAYSYAPSTKISVYLYSQSLFAFLIGIVVFDEVPDLLSLAGGALLIGAGILNFIASRTMHRRQFYEV